MLLVRAQPGRPTWGVSLMERVPVYETGDIGPIPIRPTKIII